MSDIIVVGAGISGLYSALRLIDNNYSVTLFEKSSRVGGRVYTLYTADYMIELGAFRISSQHNIIIDLCRRFNITLEPFQGASDFRPSYNSYQPMVSPFENLIHLTNDMVQTMSYDDRIDLSVARLLERTFGTETAIEYRDSGGYVDYYQSSIEQVLHTNTITTLLAHGSYYMAPQGLSALIYSMLAYLVKQPRFKIIYEAVTWVQNTTVWTASNAVYHAKAIILAIPKKNLIPISDWNPNDLLAFDGVQGNRVVKIIMRFPLVNGHVWFEGVPFTITDALLMKFLPVNPTLGLAIISYSDGIRGKYIHEVWEKNQSLLIDIMMADLRKVFSEKEIPDPIEVDQYYWSPYVHYWKTGINIEATRDYLREIGVQRRIFVVGETFSTQAWMNASLETVDDIYAQIISYL